MDNAWILQPGITISSECNFLFARLITRLEACVFRYQMDYFNAFNFTVSSFKCTVDETLTSSHRLNVKAQLLPVGKKKKNL